MNWSCSLKQLAAALHAAQISFLLCCLLCVYVQLGLNRVTFCFDRSNKEQAGWCVWFKVCATQNIIYTASYFVLVCKAVAARKVPCTAVEAAVERTLAFNHTRVLKVVPCTVVLDDYTIEPER